MAPEVSIYQFDTVEVRPRAFQVLRDGTPIALEPKAVRVLLHLIENRGRAVSKDELLSAVWGDAAVTDNALTRVIAQLRRELGDDARQARYIQTVPTLGYRFIAEVGDHPIAVQPALPAPKAPAAPGRWIAAACAIAALTAGTVFLWKREVQPVVSLARPHFTRQLTTSAGFDFSATFAPDGARIAYSSDRTGRFQIYLRPVDGGERESQITNDSSQNIQPAWSPDGKWIAYHLALKGGIWIVPAAGGPSRQVATDGSQPAWSRDNSRIAFRRGDVFSLAGNDLLSGDRPQLYVVDAAGGTPVALTEARSPEGRHTFPSWSPDGKRVLFASYTGRTAELWLADPERRRPAVRLASIERSVFVHPVYSPDGTSIYFGSLSKTRDFGIWRLRLAEGGERADGEPEEVIRTGLAVPRELAISPDGKRLAYTASTQISHVWALRMRGDTPAGEALPLFRDNVLRVSFPLYSPDGTKIAFNARVYGNNGEIYIMNADGTGAAPLTNNSVPDLLPNWTSDGSAVVYTRETDAGTQLWRTSLTDRSEKPLVNGAALFGFARLSPDGREAVLHREGDRILNVWKIDVATGGARQLTNDRAGAGFPVWSPDGKWIAYETVRGNDAFLSVMDRNGNHQTVLQTDPGQNWPNSWSPDNRKILFAAFRGGEWNLWWIDRQTREQRKLTNYSSLATYVRYPSWSPRGDSIVFEHSTTRGNVFLVDLDPGS